MIQIPASLAKDMQAHWGVAPDYIDDSGIRHTSTMGKSEINYQAGHSKSGSLFVTYRVKADHVIWRSWEHEDGQGEYIRPRPQKPKQPAPDDMPVMLKAWAESKRVDLHHPYIEKKLIIPIGIRQALKRYVIRTATTEKAEQYIAPGTLLIPAYANTALINPNPHKCLLPQKPKAFTAISSNGIKLARGPISNSHLWVGGNVGCGDGNLYISESYSSAVSVHMRTRSPVVVAFSTSGLMPVGLFLRGLFPDASIVYAADNDVGTITGGIENPGVYKATEAAKSIGATLWIPPTPHKADWNDIHVSLCPDAKTPATF